MPIVDHAALLAELLPLVDERYQAALRAGIAGLAAAPAAPSPRQRAEAIMATSPRPNCENEEWWVNQITTAIQAASNEQLERGRANTAEVKAALQAALEDLARVKQERDGLAQRLRYECPDCCGTGAVETSGPDDGQVELMACARCGPAYDELAAHDRAVAARVLREISSEGMRCLFDVGLLEMIADQYERGEREVPSE